MKKSIKLGLMTDKGVGNLQELDLKYYSGENLKEGKDTHFPSLYKLESI